MKNGEQKRQKKKTVCARQLNKGEILLRSRSEFTLHFSKVCFTVHSGHAFNHSFLLRFSFLAICSFFSFVDFGQRSRYVYPYLPFPPRPSWPGARANWTGLRASQPGYRASQLGYTASQPGLRVSHPGLSASQVSGPASWVSGPISQAK